MRILLVNPSQKTVYGKAFPQSDPPLGLLYVGAALENIRHEVRLLDQDAEKCAGADFTAFVKEYNPDLVGITSSTSIIKSALAAAADAKRAKPDTPVVLGGIHPTVRPLEVLSDPNVDMVVKGEGEITMVELTEALTRGETDLSGIDGLLWKRGGEPVQNKERCLIEDLDGVLFPARHLLKCPESYVPPDAVQPPTTSILTSRGCFGKCTYCQTKNIFGLKTRFRSPENVIAEIKECMDRYGVREFHIIDDNFILDKKRAIAICEEIKKLDRKLVFALFNGMRADCVDEEVLLALKSIGVLNVGFGVESGNEEVLRRIKKGITLDKVREAFRLTKKLGFQTWGFFIVGLPGDNNETIRDTINFAKEVDPDFAKFLILKPFPGSEVHDELERDHLIFDHDYEFYGIYTRPVHRLPDLTSEEIFRWQKRAIKEFYFRPSKIFQHLVRIKNLNQLKFNLKAAYFVIYRLFYNAK